MENPGVERAIPGALIGIVGGVLLSMFLRWISSIEPIWDFGLVLVLVPFTMITGWMWGIGAFNRKLSEHGHAHEDHDGQDEEAHHAEEKASPFDVMMNLVWRITTYSLLFFIIIYGFAEIPNGFFLRLSNNPEASAGDFARSVNIVVPGVGWEFETSQFWMFLAMIAAIVIPLVLIAGVTALLLYMGHREVAIVSGVEPTIEQLRPPAPVRFLGRVASSIGGALHKGLPRFFGDR